ncbi:putative C-type lectin domain family 20 member A [Gambusia affinis]|uniref:putative C-type lectin domain family 20 member A n=1 Tax=Gambusia affinis TaxID=33528 RepID=UPI001CDBD4B0|nr:putative C-type lectin domain family 20 member A [Gambusia affinis]
MDHGFTLRTLLLFGFMLSTFSHVREFHYINMSKTWDEARQYCREKYTDLAKIESNEDISRLSAPFSYSWVWFGLRDDPKSWKDTMGSDANSWRWSTTGETGQTTYHTWSLGEPNYGGANETCVVMTSTGQWADRTCSLQKSFICFTKRSRKEYVYITAQETWSSALTYCRTHHTDLAMIENEAENTEARNANPTTSEVWIGLYRVPWIWADGSQTLFRPWHFSLNNDAGKQHCGTENNVHQWADEDCSVRRPFICHRVLKKLTTVRIKFVTDIDWSDPAVNSQILQQLGALLTHRGWTDFRVRWKNLPSKTHKEKCAKSECKSQV